MLPQRRKSAEEIAKLRESMGVPGAAAPAAEAPPAGGPAPLEAPADGTLESSDAAFDLPPPGSPKPVRSLRKSEQKVVERKARSTPARTAGIPVRRRSDQELLELRRIQATPPDQSIAHIRHLAVAWPLVALGYLLPLSGALLGGFAAWSPRVAELDFPARWMADLSRQPWLAGAGIAVLSIFCALGLLLAGWIAWKKPRSRHHAGFIGLVTLLVLVFGILQLTSTHGT
jgi:hypothetical protein